MGFIKNSSTYFGKPSLTITNDNNDRFEDGTTLLTYDPAIGSLAPVWPRLDEPHHLLNWSNESPKELLDFTSKNPSRSAVLLLRSSLHTDEAPSDPYLTIADRILSENISWTIPYTFPGEFSFVTGYWEWLEDVLGRNKNILLEACVYDAVYASLFTYDCNPRVIRAFCELWCSSTNTLHTSNGELSISLWDLRELGGLPIRGRFYDEVVPTAEELTGINKKGALHLPNSCRYLFLAFNHLCHKVGNDYEVSISEWVHFWFKRAPKYNQLPSRNYNRRVHPPRDNCMPSGVIDPPVLRSYEDNNPFFELGVSDKAREELYLAAFLSCWLCKFVLPCSKIDLIRPSVFKVASMIAVGTKISLAVPVLASLYKGLGEISNSSSLKKCEAVFPVHYIYAWLGHYFNTQFSKPPPESTARMVHFAGEKMTKHYLDHEARDLFQNIVPSSLQTLSRCETKRQTLVDDFNLSRNRCEYFISMRSSYLTLRKDNVYIIEVYNPHRFSMQFGFCQYIPGTLKSNLKINTLQELYQLWESCTRLGTSSSVIIPALPLKDEILTTKSYVNWWSRIWRKTIPRIDNVSVKSIVVDPKLSKQKKVKVRKAAELVQSPRPSKNVGENDAYGGTNSNERTCPETPVYKPFSKRRIETNSHKENSIEPENQDDVETLVKAPRLKRLKRKSRNFDEMVDPPMSPRDDLSDECNWKHKRVEPSAPHNGIDETVSEIGEFDLANCGDNLGPPFCLPTCSELSVANQQLRDFFVDKSKKEGQKFDTNAFYLKDAEEVSSQSKGALSSQNLSIKERSMGGPEMSVFQPDKKIFEICFNASILVGQVILDRLSRPLPYSEVLSLKQDVDKCCKDIDKLGVVDSSGLRLVINEFMENVDMYLTSKSLADQQISLSERDKCLKEVDLQLSDARSIEGANNKRVESLNADLQGVQSRIAELRNEIASLETKEKDLEASISEVEVENVKNVEIVSYLEKQHSNLREAPIIADGELVGLEVIEEIIKKRRAELKDFKWWI